MTKLVRQIKSLKDRTAGQSEVVQRLAEARASIQPLEAKNAELAAEAVVANSAIHALQTELREAHEHTTTEYVHIPVTNQEAEAWKCAARRVARSNPQAEPIVSLIQGVAEQIFHGAKVMAHDKRDPLKI